MALIKKIRQRTGLAIGVITVGLIFFLVGGDILSPNSTLLGGGSNKVGEIAGESISYEEYIQKIEEIKFQFQQNTGRTPSENEMNSIREQAWQALIVDKVFDTQFDELGLTVTDAELVDMVQGKNIIAELRQQLTNPETGEFDRNQLVAFLQSLEDAAPEQRAFWAQQERLFADARLRVKYDNLLSTSEYATKAEGRMEHKMANTIADVDHLFIPFYVIADTAVNVSDSELRDYISKNKEKFKVSNAADLEYVSFSINPSSEDSAAVISEIRQLTDELKNTETDSVFALRNSDAQRPFQTILPGDALPASLTSNVDDIKEGEVYGPFLTNRSTYVTYKITRKYDGTPRMRASHILFGTQGLSDDAKSEVKQNAESVLKEIQEGLNFATAASQYGQDGTAQRGGDLGWFAKEDFVDEFADVSFAQRNTGLINRLVETEYGYHIISVTDLPKTETYKIATIERELIASDATRNDVYRNADFFATNAGNANEFRQNAEKEGYRIIQANNVDAFARNLNNLTNAREVIRWAFNDASEGKVSPVFELDNAYVVASLKKRYEEGTATLDQVRPQVLTQVRNEKKAKMIKDQISGKSTLEEMRSVFPDDASLDNTPDLKLSASVLPGVGFAPRAVGAAFGLNESGQISEPVQEDVGIIVLKLNSLTPATEVGDYSSFQRQLTLNSSQRTAYMIMMALEDLANVKDYRYKFF
ncbi:peptidyl-prolyl cis-trans isomerase [Indibacter alkaliphilus LW1]|uniref:Periplasmic chaperone PpiD n=1 Tax=Indibacter alkaliphilus (strain CCUG 57479 / KCTC 22604 / LW1) TaxID=1189612 RepID=S2DJK6_INDAL|nr:SurA N-terminal domain-containing protein [Indibacter alkaliphilus]EOZ92161.1 peptidyl-prolyl cis-trans isomerase [Indibacter alkaliphilus LW1]